MTAKYMQRRYALPVFLLSLALVNGCAMTAAVIGSKTGTKPVFERPAPEYAVEPRNDDAFFPVAQRITRQHGEQASGFRLLDSNEDGLRWRLALIDSARHSIDVQYYLWYGDAAGRLLARHLLDAADRGVRVRLLIDDLNTLLQTAARLSLRDEVAAWLDAHPNIDLRLFNPWSNRDITRRFGESIAELERVNQRMHNKALVVDNRAVIIGGRNIGDEYMGINADFNFHDLDVLGIGPAARQVSTVFDAYWNSRWVMPVSALDLPVSTEERTQGARQLDELLANEVTLERFPLGAINWEQEIQWLDRHLLVGTSEVIADLPAKHNIEQLMLDHINALIKSSQRELLIANAYIIPRKRSIGTLQALHEQGVSVKILTNSLASHDVPAVNSHYKPWRRPIIETGAELYELRHDPAIQQGIVDTAPVRGGFTGLHSKAMVVDRETSYIGSMNFDPRSVAYNTEMGIVIRSRELGEELTRLIERDMQPDNSWRVTIEQNEKLAWTNADESVSRQPARSWWQRVQDVFFRAFPKSLY